MPPLNPDVADLVSSIPELTPYDHEHAVTYMRMLDADAEGADWREVAQIVLHIDPDREPDRVGLPESSRPRQMDDQGRIPAPVATQLASRNSFRVVIRQGGRATRDVGHLKCYVSAGLWEPVACRTSFDLQQSKS